MFLPFVKSAFFHDGPLIRVGIVRSKEHLQSTLKFLCFSALRYEVTDEARGVDAKPGFSSLRFTH